MKNPTAAIIGAQQAAKNHAKRRNKPISDDRVLGVNESPSFGKHFRRKVDTGTSIVARVNRSFRGALEEAQKQKQLLIPVGWLSLLGLGVGWLSFVGFGR